MEKPLDGHSEKTPHLPTGDFSSMLVQFLRFSTHDKHIQTIQNTPRYKALSQEEQSCLDCFLTMSDYQFKTRERTARNHRRLDIGVWLVMSTSPLHPQIHQIVSGLRNNVSSLLSTEDREMLEHLFHIHEYLHNNDQLGYEQYITGIDSEKQSSLIQTYKQMIIAQTVHPNGTSSYFPYLASEKTIKIDPPQTPLPDNDTFYSQLTDPTNTQLTPPQSDLQKVFHDIVLLSNMAQYVSSVDMFQQLMHCRTHQNLGLISNEKYTSDMFYLGNTITDSESAKTSPEKRADTYIQHSYLVLQDMRTAARSLLTYRAQLHHTATGGTTYTTADHSILQQIRETIQSISQLHGRIDLHYFIRHLPSESDEEAIILQNKQNFGLILIAKEVVEAILNKLKAKNTNLIILESLDQWETQQLLPINLSQKLFFKNESLLYNILEILEQIPTSSISISKGDIVTRVIESYDGIRTISPKTDTLVSKNGKYQESLFLNELLILLEQLRSFVHAHAREKSILLNQYKQPFTSSGTEQLSVTAWCYRTVDYLRLLYATDKCVYTTFIEGFMNQINRSSATLQLFFEEQHKTITTHAHTE